MRAGFQVEELDEFLEQLLGLLAIEIEETDGEVLEIAPALDVFVVEVVVNAVVGLVRRSFDSCHNEKLVLS